MVCGWKYYKQDYLSKFVVLFLLFINLLFINLIVLFFVVHMITQSYTAEVEL